MIFNNQKPVNFCIFIFSISKNKKETVHDYWKKYIISKIKYITILSNTLVNKINSLLKYDFDFS